MTIWRASWGARDEFAERDWKTAKAFADRDQKAVEVAEDLHEEMDRRERMIGETMTAVRQKINEVELATERNFVRRVEFSDSVAMLRGELQNLAARMDRKLDAIDEKIDEIPRGQR